MTGKAKEGGARARREAREAAKRSIPVYAVFKGTLSGEVVGDPLYYSATRDGALMAADRLIQLNHADHYALWCALRGKPTEFPGGSWAEYRLTLYPDGEITDEGDVYAVAKTALSPGEAAMFLRMLSGTQPLMLPPESDEEIAAGIGAPSVSALSRIDAEAARRAEGLSAGQPGGGGTPKA